MSYENVIGNFLRLAGGTLSGVLNMGGNQITNGAAATTSTGFPIFSQVKLIQVVGTTTTTDFSTVSTTLVGTNLSLPITPTSASNRILIFSSGVAVTTIGNSFCNGTLKRGTTDLAATNLIFSLGSAGGATRSSQPVFWLDSPATTSATTYQIFIASSDTNTVHFGNGQEQVMILAEIV